jgi:hypothetical protein
MHTIILVFPAKSTFLPQILASFLLNTSMDINEFVAFLRQDKQLSSVVQLKKIHQKLYSASQLWDRMPADFIKKYHIEPEHFIGLEFVRPGDYLALHTDIGGRRSNILLNVGEHPATIQHTNNDVTEDYTIQPGDFFVLDTTKEHGCDNRQSNTIAEFVTINNRKHYSECIAQF